MVDSASGTAGRHQMEWAVPSPSECVNEASTYAPLSSAGGLSFRKNGGRVEYLVSIATVIAARGQMIQINNKYQKPRVGGLGQRAAYATKTVRGAVTRSPSSPYNIYRYPLHLSPFAFFASSTVANLPFSFESCLTVSGSPTRQKKNQPIALPGIAAHEHTPVIHTIDNFVTQSSIAPDIFGFEGKVVRQGSE